MSAKTNQTNADAGRFLIIPILLLAFALRIYRVGTNSFWLDEVYQMIAAAQPSVSAMMLVISHYTMSLPLDYLVSWVVSRLDSSETVMRFPAVFWGVLTIAMSYVVARQVSGKTVIALAAALWLTVLAQHIHYSQELRFYASLSFFYLLSTYLVIRALERPGWKNWTIFIALTSLGIYFHPYVAMAGLNGVAWLLLSNRVPSQHRRSGWAFLVLAGVILVLVFVPGYLSNQIVEYFPLLFWGIPFEQIIAVGLGWTWTLSGVLYVGLAVVGAAGAIYSGNQRLMAALAALVAQVALVVAADWLKGFWFANRQLVHLLALAALFAGCGTVFVASWLSALASSRKLASIAVALFVVVSAVPALLDYYAWPKSSGREIADELIQRTSSTDMALVIPGYNAKVLVYYLHRVGAVQLEERVMSSDWSSLDTDVHKPVPGGRTYLVTQAVLSQEQQSLITTLGFTVRLDHNQDLPGAQALYVRP
jgi:uncharacterized membrane protein